MKEDLKITFIENDVISGLKSIQENSIDLIITSPPYNIGIKYENWNDSIPWKNYWNWTSKWLFECFRVLKNTGRICIDHYIGLYDSIQKEEQFPICTLIQLSKNFGFKNHRIIIWEEKTKSKLTAWGSWLSASAPFIQMPYEGIMIASKGEWKKENKGESTLSKSEFIEGVSGIWNISTSKKKDYPATFPLTLPLKCINLLSYKGDTILDPFMGSGTTGVACKMSERNFIGIDNSKKSIEISKKNINNFIMLF